MAVLTGGWRRLTPPGECLGWQAQGAASRQGMRRNPFDLLLRIRLRDGRQAHICWTPRAGVQEQERGVLVRYLGWRDSNNRRMRPLAPQRRTDPVTPALVAELIGQCLRI